MWITVFISTRLICCPDTLDAEDRMVKFFWWQSHYLYHFFSSIVRHVGFIGFYEPFLLLQMVIECALKYFIWKRKLHLFLGNIWLFLKLKIEKILFPHPYLCSLIKFFQREPFYRSFQIFYSFKHTWRNGKQHNKKPKVVRTHGEISKNVI